MSTTGRSTATSSACARSSSRSIPSSPKSKPCMALDTVTATTDRRESPTGAGQRSKPRTPAIRRLRVRLRAPWSLSPLTRRILTVNVLTLALLGVGVLYLGEYQDSLVTTNIESLKTQAEIFAAAVGEGAVDQQRASFKLDPQ